MHNEPCLPSISASICMEVLTVIHTDWTETEPEAGPYHVRTFVLAHMAVIQVIGVICKIGFSASDHMSEVPFH